MENGPGTEKKGRAVLKECGSDRNQIWEGLHWLSDKTTGLSQSADSQQLVAGWEMLEVSRFAEEQLGGGGDAAGREGVRQWEMLGMERLILQHKPVLATADCNNGRNNFQPRPLQKANLIFPVCFGAILTGPRHRLSLTFLTPADPRGYM